MNYAYDQVDQAHRDLELQRLKDRRRALTARWHELAVEIGEYSKQLFIDQDAGDLTASLAHMAMKMSELAGVIDDVREVENEMGEMG